jgi:phage terminase large subunit
MGRAETRFTDLIDLTDRQREAWLATYRFRYVLYGGARGGGKSKFLRWWLPDYLVYLYKTFGLRNVRVMLACETYRDLADRQLTKMRTEYPDWMGTMKHTEADGLGFFMPESLGGGVIALRNLDDPSKYQSAEFAAIAVDELTKNQKDTFDILRGSLRWPGVDHTVFVAATNPGGPGHMWVKQLWIDRDFPPELQDRAGEFVFIQSLPKDNPHLEQSYWDELNSLPPDLARAWVEGDWSVFAGQAFGQWRNHLHVVNPRDFPIPAHWPKWRAVDWGYAAPFCCLWFARDPDNGRVVVYREAYQVQLTDRQQARVIRDLTPPQENVTMTYADPALWAKKNMQDVVTTTADEYAVEHVYLTQADNDRMNGKRKVDRMLGLLPDGRPGLLVYETCANLIRTLPALAYDKTHVEDVDTTQEDHAYDTLRYGLTTVRDKQEPRKSEPSPMTRRQNYSR